VQLKLTEFETRIAHLERLSDEFEGKSTARSLPLDLSSFLPFPSPIFLCLYVVPSWPHARQELKG
jgi:hypothetical protein